jgi:hypothetical protein
MPTDAAGERLLQLFQAEVAELDLSDAAFLAALERYVAAALTEVETAPGAQGLTPDEAGRVALAVVSGAITLTDQEATPLAAGPRVRDLSTRALLRRALGRTAGRG